MYYEAELDYLLRVLKKMRVQAHCVTAREAIEMPFDFGLRRFLGMEKEYELAQTRMTEAVRSQTIYKVTDQFMCNYIFLGLPRKPDHSMLIVGPYISFELTDEWLLEEAERFNLPVRRIPQLKDFYSGIPSIPDATLVLNMLSTFGETLWGIDSTFEILDIDQEITSLPASQQSDRGEQMDALMRMKQMEIRYAHENEMMEVVAKGHTRQAELMMSGFSQALFEQRVADPVRNLKNYCIICNTLMRKAAERGGVHPVHLDRASSGFAAKIETVSGFDSGYALMREMARDYCRLVRKFSLRQYSPPVQKTVTYIQSDPTGDLGLCTLAQLQNISPSYLSALFRKETGKTITDFVNETRMQAAARLLHTTRLQVQTVAQHCGMSDVNYFSKVFKRYYGVTPRQFREADGAYGWKTLEQN